MTVFYSKRSDLKKPIVFIRMIYPLKDLRKAEGSARTAKKGSSKSRISGSVEGVIRYKKNGKISRNNTKGLMEGYSRK